MFGYMNRIAFIDLTSGKIEFQSLDDTTLKLYLGGRGYAAKLIIDLTSPKQDALSPESPLVFFCGALTGTLVPTSARLSVGARAPETGILGIGNVGGFFGARLRAAGLDGLVIQGKAAKPVYLFIDQDGIRILPADKVWGKDTRETEHLLRAAHSQPALSVCCIGQAGESLAPIATIMVDKVRSGGRGGLGAVMGSKNLKAVAVFGTSGVRIAEPKHFTDLCLEISKRAVKRYFKGRWKNGTYGALTRYNAAGALSTRNAQTTAFDGIDGIDAQTYNTTFKKRMRACFSCSVPCWSTYAVSSGTYSGLMSESVNASTFKELGARVGLRDMDAILVAHDLLNRYGLDTISAPAAIAFAMECYEKELLTPEITRGKMLCWGNAQVIIELIHEMAAGTGLGGELSQGVRACAARWGTETVPYALHVKGMETVATDPRGQPSWGLQYATSSRGADHMRAYSNFEYNGLSDSDMLRIAGTTKIAERFGTEGKGRAVAYLEDMHAYGDALGVCRFMTRGEIGFPEVLAPLYQTATGIPISTEQLLNVGERITNLERLSNLRDGITPADDTLPGRYLKEPVPDGPAKGRICDLQPMLDEYYQARDWDMVSGYPSQAKLEQLGLEHLQ